MRNDLESPGDVTKFFSQCIVNMHQKKRFSGVKKTLNTDDLPLEFFSAGCILHQEEKLFTRRAQKKITAKWY